MSLRHHIWTLPTIPALALTVVAQVHADPQTHDGFYMSLQGGLGYLSSTAESAGFETTVSGMTLASSLLLGGTVGPVVIGGGFTYDAASSPTFETNGMEFTAGDVSSYLIGIGAFVDYYVDPTEGLHFLGFVGWGGLETSVDGNVGGSDPTGTVIHLGGGYDFWIGDEWSIGPLARFTYAPLELNGVDYSTTHFALLADLKFH